jgi:hypothetical protein
MARFNIEKCREDAKQRRVKAGFHAVVSKAAETHTPAKEENNHLMTKMSLQILKDIDDPNSYADKRASFNVWNTLPLENEEVDGHSVDRWVMPNWIPWAAALFPEDCRDQPRRKNKAKTGPHFYGGEEIEKEDYPACYDEAMRAAGEKALEIWGEAGDNLDLMVGKVFVVEVSYGEDPAWPDIKPVNMVPEDAEFVDPEDCLEVVGDGANGKDGEVVTKDEETGGNSKRPTRKRKKKGRRAAAARA